ncbi:hypothetical protein LLG95_03610 [bacterium]|nr:hypothetical protein [bacterium]
MSIASISASTQAKATTATTSSAGLGKNDFLQLMIAQLENQDPLNPADATQYTSQLCQFSSLEQLINANDNLGTLTSTISNGSRTNAASYIGRTVSMSGSQITLAGGTATTTGFDLAGNAADVSVEVYDSTGSIVRSVNLGQLDSGDHSFTWDGKNSAGVVQPDGTYAFKVVASDSDGNAIDATTNFTGTVNSIEFENGKTLLNIGGLSWPLDNVLSIK